MRLKNTGRKRRSKMLLLLMVLAIASILFAPGNIRQVRAADGTEIRIPYEQTWSAAPEGTQADDTFYYQLEPTGNAPAPAEAENGILNFSIKGNASGELVLNIPFESPGYYRYRISADAEQQEAGYTYEKETYTVMVMVMNDPDGGFMIGPIVIQDSSLAKYVSVPLSVSYRGNEPVNPPASDPESDEPANPPASEPESDEPANPPASDPGSDRPTRSPAPNTEPDRPARSPAPGTEPDRPERTPVPDTAADEPDENEPARTVSGVPETESEPETEPDDRKIAEIEEGEIPLAGFDPSDQETGDDEKQPETTCALLNLIFMIAAAAIGIVLTVLFIKGEKTGENDGTEEKKEETKQRRKARLAGLIPAAAAIILFFITEDLGGKMILTDQWTVWMLILLIAEAATAFFSRNQKKKNETVNRIE